MSKKNKTDSKTEVTEESYSKWLGTLEEFLDRIDPKDAERAVRDLERFMDGEIEWAEVQGVPSSMLYEAARVGYLKIKSGRLSEAEAIFRSLRGMDSTTAYYHTALGTIYQKQERYMDAIFSYTIALELDSRDIAAYVNRGEIYFKMGLDELPFEDFDQAIKLDPEKTNPWSNRARILEKQYREYLSHCV